MSSSIKRLFISESDRRNLSRLRVDPVDPGRSIDYKGLIVNKPWGYEYLLFQNAFVAVWILSLKKSAATSMHCHPLKKTSMLVLDGLATCSTLEGWHDCAPSQGLIIDSGVFHSTQAQSVHGTFLMEVESPPIKEDLARLKDSYGRAGSPYEGQDQMTRDTKKFTYIDFHDKKTRLTKKKLKECTFSIVSAADFFTQKYVSNSIICLIAGSSTNSRAPSPLAVGEIAPHSQVLSMSQTGFTKDAQFLVIEYKKS